MGSKLPGVVGRELAVESRRGVARSGPVQQAWLGAPPDPDGSRSTLGPQLGVRSIFTAASDPLDELLSTGAGATVAGAAAAAAGEGGGWLVTSPDGGTPVAPGASARGE